MLLLLCCVCSVHAQNGSRSSNAISGYAGRYFLIGFMQNELILLPGGIRLSVAISTIRSTTIRIAAPISRPSQYYQVPGDTVIELTFPYGDVEMFDSERAQAKAIEIEADQPITITGMSSQSLSTDGFSAIPVAKWGREYVVHSWPNDIYMHDDDPQGKIPRSSEFMIIAAENNTVIEFAPRSRTFGKIQPNESTIIRLNKGQCYLVKSDTLPAGSGDLSGTIIRSDKPVGVFSGHLRASIPLGLQEFDSKNHLTEMLYPTEKWGKSFVTLPFNNDGIGDFFRIHCIEPNTNVTVKGWNINQQHLLANPGDFKTLSFIRDPLLIEADKPISIAQYMTSSFSANQRLQTFDPCMMLIPSIDKVITKASFHVVQNPSSNPRQFLRHFISLVCTEDAVDHIKLDNRLIKTIVSNLPNQRLNGTQLFYATVPVTPGTHHLTTMEGAFNAALYGTGPDDAYAFPLAFGMVQGIDTSAPHIVMKDSCGFIKATIKERLIDDYSGLFDLSVIRDSTVNMNWAISGIRDGDLSASFTASVINMLKDASIVIESIDNAGNSSRSRYTYTAPKISIPDTLSFQKIRNGDTVRTFFNVRNIGKDTIQIKFANLDGDDRFRCLNIIDLTDKKLAPNDTFALAIEFIGRGDKDSARANIRIFLGCGIVRNTIISGLMESVSLSVSGYDFGNVSVGDTSFGFIHVANTGGTSLTATQLVGLQNDQFKVDTMGLFPKVISPRDTLKIPCKFSPLIKGEQLEVFTINNDKSLPNQGIVKGNGLLPSINPISIDWKERHIQSTNDTIARIINTGNDTAFVSLDSTFGKNIIFNGTFAGGLKLLQLAPNQSTSIICTFKPDDTIRYEQKGYLYYTNGFVRDSVNVDVYGKGVIPIINQQDIYVGTIRELGTKDTTGLLFKTAGTMPLFIESFSILSGDRMSFIIDTASLVGTTYLPYTSLQLPIKFVPKRSGSHTIEVEIVSNAAPYGQKSITRSIISGDALPLDTIALRLEVQAIDTMYVCEKRVITGKIINEGNKDIMLDSLTVTSRFSISNVIIQHIDDSTVKMKGGEITFTALIDSQGSGTDFIDFTAFLQDSLQLKEAIPIYVKSNHVRFAPAMNNMMKFLPGSTITVLLQGTLDISKKTSQLFEPRITLNYSSATLDCMISNTDLILNSISGQVRIPMQITSNNGTTLLTAQTQSTIQGSGFWQTSLEFRTFLTDTPRDITLHIHNMQSYCINGDTAIIPLEMTDFCARDIRGVTSDLKGQGLLGIYPQPIQYEGNVSFLLHEESEFTLDIRNILGESVKFIQGKGSAGHNIIPFRTEDLPSGAYILIFQSFNSQNSRPFLITKD